MTTDPDQIITDILAEFDRNNARWGDQSHLLDGTSEAHFRRAADHHRQQCQTQARYGTVNWGDILLEEVYEALAEEDPVKLRAELVQVGAVALAWVEAIDRRQQEGEWAKP